MTDKILKAYFRRQMRLAPGTGMRGTVTVSHIRCCTVNFVVQNKMQATVESRTGGRLGSPAVGRLKNFRNPSQNSLQMTLNKHISAL